MVAFGGHNPINLVLVQIHHTEVFVILLIIIVVPTGITFAVAHFIHPISLGIAPYQRALFPHSCVDTVDDAGVLFY